MLRGRKAGERRGGAQGLGVGDKAGRRNGRGLKSTQ